MWLRLVEERPTISSEVRAAVALNPYRNTLRIHPAEQGCLCFERQFLAGSGPGVADVLPGLDCDVN